MRDFSIMIDLQTLKQNIGKYNPKTAKQLQYSAHYVENQQVPEHEQKKNIGMVI